MPSSSRLLPFTLALILGFTFAAPTVAAAHRPHHSQSGKSKKHAKSKKKIRGKKKKPKKKKKKGHPKRAKHRTRPAPHPYVVPAPRAAPLAPNVVRAAPPPPNPYSASPSGPTLPSHTVIPLHDPAAPVEEHRVQLDMTRPYGQATPLPLPAGAERGLASEHPEAPPSSAP